MNNIISTLASVLPNDIVFGKSFRTAKAILSTYESSKDKMDFVNSFQQEKLRNMLHLAKKTASYHYLNDGLAFERIPFIDKDIILQSQSGFVLSKRSSDYVTTGGTSGKPLGFYINKNRKGFEWFWITNNWSKIGFNLGDYRAVLTNHKLNGKDYQVNYLLKEYQYNNFSLNDKYMDFIIDHINSKKIKFLRAYPSAAYMLAKYIQRAKKVTTLKYFLCGSENIFPFQKQLIQDELNIRMYSWYGHSEKLILAGENRVCENYHSIPFYGYTEIVDEKGNCVEKKGSTGELVGTGFMNTKMPFIRYRTGDFAEYVGETCPDCGHIGLTFKKVKGRWEGDRIYKSDNTIITTTALNLHSNIYDFIQNMQYVQEEKGVLEVRVIPGKNYTSSVREKILSEISRKVGSNLKVNLKEVNSVEYSAINKFQLLIQKIKEDPSVGLN